MFVALAAGLVLTAAVQASTLERSYLFGDDSFESATVGNPVTSTLDSTRLDFFVSNDLSVIGGAGAVPTYVDASARPGAIATNKAIQLDGVDDRLYMPGGTIPGPGGTAQGSLGVPSTGDNRYGNPPTNNFSSNGGIQTRFMDAWVFPTNSAATTGFQDIISDSNEFRIRINNNEDDQATPDLKVWRITNGTNSTDTILQVAFNQWHHVMHRTIGNANSLLYVNGIAVAGTGGYGNPGADNFVIGADDTVAGANFYGGIVDDLKIGVAGNNSPPPPGIANNANGQNWGAFDLAVDNDFVRQALAAIGNKRGDVNRDNTVDTVDRDILIANWLRTFSVNNVRAGDLASHDLGDLDFDGDVDLADAFLLRTDLVGPGSGGSIPEPCSFLMAALAMTGIASIRRRRS
jgi:hypothetical protein